MTKLIHRWGDWVANLDVDGWFLYNMCLMACVTAYPSWCITSAIDAGKGDIAGMALLWAMIAMSMMLVSLMIGMCFENCNLDTNTPDYIRVTNEYVSFPCAYVIFKRSTIKMFFVCIGIIPPNIRRRHGDILCNEICYDEVASWQNRDKELNTKLFNVDVNGLDYTQGSVPVTKDNLSTYAFECTSEFRYAISGKVVYDLVEFKTYEDGCIPL